MNFKKINNLVNMEMAQGNHVLVSVDFRRKLAVNMYIFKKADDYEIPQNVQECITTDPILKNKGLGHQEQKQEFDNVVDINSRVRAS